MVASIIVQADLVLDHFQYYNAYDTVDLWIHIRVSGSCQEMSVAYRNAMFNIRYTVLKSNNYRKYSASDRDRLRV